MKQYLIYGTKKDWYYSQCSPEPLLIVASDKDEALETIAEKFYGLFKEALDVIHLPVPKDTDLAIAFLTGEISEDGDYHNECVFIEEESGCIIYDDTAFFSDREDADIDAASTLILGMAEQTIDTDANKTAYRKETVIPLSLENDILPLIRRMINSEK